MSAVLLQEGNVLGTSAAARTLGVSEEWIRILCDRGDLESIRDSSNRRLITAGSVRDLVEKRKLAAAEKHP